MYTAGTAVKYYSSVWCRYKFGIVVDREEIVWRDKSSEQMYLHEMTDIIWARWADTLEEAVKKYEELTNYSVSNFSYVEESSIENLSEGES